MEDAINKLLREYGGQVKLTILIQLALDRINNPGPRTETLQTGLILDIGSCKYDLNQSLHDIAEKLFRDIELFKGCESEWSVNELECLDIITTPL